MAAKFPGLIAGRKIYDELIAVSKSYLIFEVPISIDKMTVQTIYHTGFVVKNLDEALEFYTGTLGMIVERDPAVSDTPWIAAVVGYENVKMRVTYVGVGDGHSIELIQYIEPQAEIRTDQFDRNCPGSAHAAMIVDNVSKWRERLESKGIEVFGPRYKRDVEYPWAQYAIYFQDPDGNWLEMASRGVKPLDSKQN